MRRQALETASTAHLGIDVGGTFTDCVLQWSEDDVRFYKVPTTPSDPSVGVAAGLGEMASDLGLELSHFLGRVSLIVHGTTVATNALLTRRGARTAVITTNGVRDALRMRLGVRRDPYNVKQGVPEPLVPRSRCMPVAERVDATGRVRQPLQRTDVERSVAVLEQEGVTAVAICFMHSYANSEHEQLAAAVVQAALPTVFVAISSELLPQFRFYNRLSTTVLNAYVGPTVASYLSNLTDRLEEAGFRGTLLIMQSNGGVAAPEVVRKSPVSTLLSGPAAAPAAGLAYVEPQDYRDCITLDMGGTSCDLTLIQNGAPLLVTDGQIDGQVIALPMLAIHTLGAGGGSIAWLDSGNLLHMGPQSAGADPGPACYGRGGTEPTSTDADLVLGYLDAGRFLSRRMKLDAELAERAIVKIADVLGAQLHDVALGMYDVLNVNIAAGVREVAVGHGIDPREFPLVVAGGAGPLHACTIARELELPLIVVPRQSSVLCALGMLATDLKHDFVQTYAAALTSADWTELGSIWHSLVQKGFELLAAEGIATANMNAGLELSMRYRGQYHEVAVDVDETSLTAGDYEAVAQRFHERHLRLFGHDLPHAPIEIVGLRASVVGPSRRLELPKIPNPRSKRSAISGERSVLLPDREAVAIPVYEGDLLYPGDELEGPAIIEQPNTTVLMLQGFRAQVDDFGSLLMSSMTA